MLKPQDLVVAFKVALQSGFWAYVPMAQELGMSQAEVHAAMHRLMQAQLATEDADPTGRAWRRVRRQALCEFVLHGARYVFYPELGPETRGVATAYSAEPLKSYVVASNDSVVWPDADGLVRGMGLKPLYKSVPHAARLDPALHELLALFDGIRIGRARERAFAVEELRKRLEGTS